MLHPDTNRTGRTQMTFAAVLLCLLGFISIALGMEKHHRTLLGTNPSKSVALLVRVAGWSALAVAVTLCVSTFGAGYGLVLFNGLLTVAGLSVVAFLSSWSSRQRVVRR